MNTEFNYGLVVNQRTMPCISLWQPWAQWVALGWKTIETRTHRRFAGLAGKTIAIHATQHWDVCAVVTAQEWLTPDMIRDTVEMRLMSKQSLGGAIICTARVTSHRALDAGDSAGALIECKTQRYGLFLSDVRKVEPIPTKGRQGLFRVPLIIN